ncbi:MAG: helix-turn-helix domain-containing protein [Lawsonibacter sp.]
MAISYKKLFHLLIDRGMKEGEFRRITNISAPTLAKLRTGQVITTEMIDRVCATLHVQPGDIMEYIDKKHSEENE